MSELKCPFCQQELRNCCAGVIYTCSKPDSCPHEQCYGSKELWQELIRTRKALDIIAKEFHKETMPDFAVIRDALKTALEQKD